MLQCCDARLLFFSGDVRGKYPLAIQTVLPWLLLAAAPPGNSAQENRRQCQKASEGGLIILLYNSTLFMIFTRLRFFCILGFEALVRSKDPPRVHCSSPYA